MSTLKYYSAALAACILLFLSYALPAQQPDFSDTSAWVRVRTTDGNEFVGQILSQDTTAVVLKTDLFGKLVLHRVVIKTIRPTARPKIVDGKIWFENPHAPRYMVVSSAYNLRKGEGVYENSELFLNQVSYGFTDYFSLGAGFSPFLLFDDGPFPVWLQPKFSFPIKKEKAYVALGGLIGHEFGGYNDEVNANDAFNAAYCQFTYGSRDANITASLGFNFSHGQWSEKPIFSLAGAVRVESWFSVVGESYFLRAYDESVKYIGFGGRFMGRRIALDAGVAVLVEEYGGIYPVPWGSLHVPFTVGKK